MKMSEAILLGYPEIGHTNSVWLHHDAAGKCEGCAIGAALYAMGVAAKPCYTYINEVRAFWPWTNACSPSGLFGTLGFMGAISREYEKVITGQQTIEQLVDWVRSVEPADDPVEVKAVEPEYATVTK